MAIGQGSIADRTNSVSVGSQGNEKVIANVARAERDTDATNLGQVKDIVANGEKRVAAKLHKTDRKLRAGIAGATAMANIPQAVTAGKNAIGVGVGSHNGENAIAAGYSRVSDDNKIIFKLSGSTNTRGGYNAGAGVSYQW